MLDDVVVPYFLDRSSVVISISVDLCDLCSIWIAGELTRAFEGFLNCAGGCISRPAPIPCAQVMSPECVPIALVRGVLRGH